ncbi:integrase core domain-containing protein [Kribbella sp. NBC_01484]|uniref:integrase core domain-containing protein n=1 Tax=Kribbella sp. NBC_01484 TaxID=2903579 RepID=UPI002E2F4E48|nr:integrase core domain-containing protein [Kribbella sp. NBC_01484]
MRGGKDAVAGVIFHSDQGSEYTAGSLQAACTRLGITQSIGRVGSALDNAVIEAWHSTVEFELRMLEHFTTKPRARTRVAAWIEEYNHDRRHSALGMRSPIDYELTLPARDPQQAPEHAARTTRSRPPSLTSSSSTSRPGPYGVASGQP